MCQGNNLYANEYDTTDNCTGNYVSHRITGVSYNCVTSVPCTNYSLIKMSYDNSSALCENSSFISYGYEEFTINTTQMGTCAGGQYSYGNPWLTAPAIFGCSSGQFTGQSYSYYDKMCKHGTHNNGFVTSIDQPACDVWSAYYGGYPHYRYVKWELIHGCVGTGTISPTAETLNPTNKPTQMPTTASPTMLTNNPTTASPTVSTVNPSNIPTQNPITASPTVNPSSVPTVNPTTSKPTEKGTSEPTNAPVFTTSSTSNGFMYDFNGVLFCLLSFVCL